MKRNVDAKQFFSIFRLNRQEKALIKKNNKRKGKKV